jgi:hypothetical protein
MTFTMSVMTFGTFLFMTSTMSMVASATFFLAIFNDNFDDDFAIVTTATAAAISVM